MLTFCSIQGDEHLKVQKISEVVLFLHICFYALPHSNFYKFFYEFLFKLKSEILNFKTWFIISVRKLSALICYFSVLCTVVLNLLNKAIK